MTDYISMIADAIEKGASHPEISEVRKVSDLVITTGNLVICDPMVYPESEYLNQKFPTGKFPVYIYFYAEEGFHALGEVKFSENPVVEWKMALVDGQNPEELSEGEIFGYPVDSGLGCFMDAETRDLMLDHEQQLINQLGDDFSSYYDNFVADYLEIEDYCSIQYSDNKQNNAVIFQTGYGDGFYGSYIGYDASGKPVCLVTDFGLIGSEE